MQTRFQNIASLGGFLALCLAVSAIGGVVTRTAVHDWYQELAKPSFTPPDWVFAPIWITLYLLMGVSVWLVWWRAENRNRRVPMTAFGVQLALNLAWSFIFFGARSIGVGRDRTRFPVGRYCRQYFGILGHRPVGRRVARSLLPLGVVRGRFEYFDLRA